MGLLFVPGDPIEMLELLRGADLAVELDADGRIKVSPSPVPEWAREVVRANRQMLMAVLDADRVGCVWARCSECGQGSIVKRGSRRKCRHTPGCDGKHAT
jgi:hypothetical protein